jgi:hypothetical protein
MKEENDKSVRVLGSSIIFLTKYWSLSQDQEFQTNLHIILPTDILLSVQILESNLLLV